MQIDIGAYEFYKGFNGKEIPPPKLFVRLNNVPELILVGSYVFYCVEIANFSDSIVEVSKVQAQISGAVSLPYQSLLLL